MARKVRSIFLYITGTIVFLASIYCNLDRNSVITDDNLLRLSPLPLTSTIPITVHNNNNNNYNRVVHEEQHLTINTNNHSNHSNNNYDQEDYSSTSTSNSTTTPPPPPPPASLTNSTMHQPLPISSIAILFPAWQVLVVRPPHDVQMISESSKDLVCIFPNKETSIASPSGVLRSPARETYTCDLPTRTRRRLPFPQPVLVKQPAGNYPATLPAPELFRWDFIAYDVLFAEKDVVLFAKGVNKRQGVNRAPQEFSCVFGDHAVDGVRTAVTSSSQEVFRCQSPNLTAVTPSITHSLYKVALEFTAEKKVIPSVAYGAPALMIANKEPKSLLCACTMVYNVAKFLREWVTYHAKIGVEKFILYDNGSDDELSKVVEELNKDGYFVSTKFWLWPKTQEAGFSHCAISHKDSCSWMMYVDVDEFVYSNAWSNSSSPSKSMLQSLLLPSNFSSEDDWVQNEPKVGEIMIGCHEFGPSNQTVHPIAGVMQGYNCRKVMENRHKSIVLLDAINESLLNVIHHFDLKQGYKMKKMSGEDVVVNHYKYQAWPEFKAKFRRRVSAYVVDWTQTVNPDSNDRTPGLGFSAVEPEGWPEKFCEVRDDGLKELAQKWFSVDSTSRHQIA